MNTKRITQTLSFASAIAVVLDLGRGDVFSPTSLAYLIWNLFLAWIPYMIAVYWIKKDFSIKKFLPIFFLWLIFFPNAPYLITDILHIVSSPLRMLWYDSLLFFFFAWVGLFLGMISLFYIEEYLRVHFKSWISELSILLICFLSSFGIYLGRFERWNSWDLFTHPVELIKNSYLISMNLGQNRVSFVFVVIFSICIYVAYKMMYVLLKKE